MASGINGRVAGETRSCQAMVMMVRGRVRSDFAGLNPVGVLMMRNVGRKCI